MLYNSAKNKTLNFALENFSGIIELKSLKALFCKKQITDAKLTFTQNLWTNHEKTGKW